jgi:multidrug efflux system membrane fusion protein
MLSSPLTAQELTGVSEWAAKVVLSTTVSGMVSKVSVAAGDEVAQGALLVELDASRYQARLAAAQSMHEVARQLNEEARRELERTLELYDRTLLSDHELKLAEIEAAKAEAALREAEAKRVEARLQLDYSRIKAPFKGRVVAVHVQPGQAVLNRLEATPLVTLVDQGQMLARAQVDERTLLRLRIGDKVEVGIRGDGFDGEITSLGYEPLGRSESGSSYRLEARFTPAKGMELRAGEQVVIRLADE